MPHVVADAEVAEPRVLLLELESRARRSRSGRATTIQKPTSTSETSVASEPAQRRGSGTSQTTSAPAIGSKIRMVVSQSLIGGEEDDGEDGEPARERERVGADEAVLDAAELGRADPEAAGRPRRSSRAITRPLDEPARTRAAWTAGR